MTIYMAALGHDLDFAAKLKRGVRGNPWAWYAAAGILGLLLSKIPPLRRTVVVKGPRRRSEAPREAGKAAIVLSVLKFVLDFAKPALVRWLKDRYLGRRAASPATPV